MEGTATPRQTWYLKLLTGKDYRDDALSREDAGRLISQAKGAKMRGKINQDKGFNTIWKEATQYAHTRLMECIPTPMVVQQHSSVLDDNSPVEKEWYVGGGVCGFAWVNVKPATTAFAKWLIANDLARKDTYYGGITIWATVGGQSMERKIAWAGGLAKVLNTHGLDAHVMSRMD